jgi:hypothetical protein
MKISRRCLLGARLVVGARSREMPPEVSQKLKARHSLPEQLTEIQNGFLQWEGEGIF